MQLLSVTDICNLALLRLGQRKIAAITDQTDGNAIACNVGYGQALGEVSRAQPWSCLKKRAFLGQLPANLTASPAIYPPVPSTATTWVPGTAYAVNAYVIYAGYLYQCLIANTASTSFAYDLTRGCWFQTDTYSPNYLGPPQGNAGSLYEWTYGYELPGDFVLLVELNGVCQWGSHVGRTCEIYQKGLYTNAASANIKYSRWEPDPTNYDPLFTGALVLNLACIIATSLRKDDARLSLTLRQEYKDYLCEARQKDGAEIKPRRYNPVSESRFVRSRWNSTNG
jgi:hypothetical protein